MYFCYVDESGIPDVPGNTSHFVLAGISVPVWHWRDCDQQLRRIKGKYRIEGEIHVAWILRPYLEQSRIQGFEQMDDGTRRARVTAARTGELLRLQRAGNSNAYRQARKNYVKTAAYIHLTYDERRQFIREVARRVGRWGFARLFAECIDKVHFVGAPRTREIHEQALEQVVSRFEKYLQLLTTGQSSQCYGVLIHDNNPTVAKKQTELMREFHQSGTDWTNLEAIIETPLFVDSSLTDMVQVADLCAYALRRYLENGEEELFDLVFPRADRKDSVVVGVRHFTTLACSCRICAGHRR